MNRRRKISQETADELVRHYLEHGRQASEIKCVEAGVSPKYASSTAAAMGLGRPRYRAGNRYKDNKVSKRLPRSELDHRWQWARQRGVILA